MPMANGDNKNYLVARNGMYTRAKIGNIERHNERKNEAYTNTDIDLSRSDLNVYFKKTTDGYITTFDKMCETGTISTKGLKENAIHYNELLFDVNTDYFEEHGGYEFAQEFFQKAYEYAVKEVGDEQYILSAVMHADERNKESSDKYGYHVYHYHLHVVYVPVVQKEVKWSKRCKDKSLVGTVKEVITQVSHSKKWASKKITLENGETYLEKSYSLLQDRFFEYMRNCGYKDIERGEKGSTEKHKSTLEFKADKEKERLHQIENKMQKSEKTLSVIVEKQTKLKAVETVETKVPLVDKSKVIVDKNEFEDLKTLAKKQIVTDSKEKKLTAENKLLKQENTVMKTEILEFNSVRSKLTTNKDKMRVAELEKFQETVYKFLDKFGVRKQFDDFMKMFQRQKNEVQR